MEFPWLDEEGGGLTEYQLLPPSGLDDEEAFQMALDQGIHNSLAGQDMEVDPAELGLNVSNMWDILSDDPAMFDLGPPPESSGTLELPPPQSSADAASGAPQPEASTDRPPERRARDPHDYIPRDMSGKTLPDVEYFILLTRRNVKKCFRQVRDSPAWADVDKLTFVRDELTYLLNSAGVVLKRLRQYKVNELKAVSAAVIRIPRSSSNPSGRTPSIILVPPSTGKPLRYYQTRLTGSLDASFLPGMASRSRAFDAVLAILSDEDANTLKSIYDDMRKGYFDQLCVDAYHSTYEFEIKNARGKGLDPSFANILYECKRFPESVSTARRLPGIVYPATRARVRCTTITDTDFKFQFDPSNAETEVFRGRIEFILATMPTISMPVDPTKLYPRELAALVAFRKFCWYGFHTPLVGSNLYPAPTRWGGVPCFLFEGKLWTPGARVCLLAYAATCCMLGYLDTTGCKPRSANVPTLWFFANYMMLNQSIRMLYRRALVKGYKTNWAKRDKSAFTLEQYVAVGLLGLLDVSETHRQLMPRHPAVIQLIPAICASTNYSKKKRNVIDAKHFDRLFGEYLTYEAQVMLPETLGKLGKPSLATMMACAVPLNERGRYVLDEDTRNSVIKLGFPLQQQQ